MFLFPLKVARFIVFPLKCACLGVCGGLEVRTVVVCDLLPVAATHCNQVCVLLPCMLGRYVQCCQRISDHFRRAVSNSPPHSPAYCLHVSTRLMDSGWYTCDSAPSLPEKFDLMNLVNLVTPHSGVQGGTCGAFYL